MKDIPLFTTQNGIASLTLKEIPYTKKAYIRIQSSAEPLSLIDECCDFCRALGAEEIYGTGHTCLEQFDRYCRIIRMRSLIKDTEDTGASLFPVTDKTIEKFREIYNKAMGDIPNAAHMTTVDGKELLVKGGGYFVHRDGELLGIGIAKGDKVDAIVSVMPGSGKAVLMTLFHALADTTIELEVAVENSAAIRLYEKVGFVPVEEVAIWYKII